MVTILISIICVSIIICIFIDLVVLIFSDNKKEDKVALTTSKSFQDYANEMMGMRSTDLRKETMMLEARAQQQAMREQGMQQRAMQQQQQQQMAMSAGFMGVDLAGVNQARAMMGMQSMSDYQRQLLVSFGIKEKKEESKNNNIFDYIK